MKNLKSHIVYVVTKSSTDNSIVKGDIVWLSVNGDLNLAQERCWLTKAEWDVSGTNDFEVEECRDYYLDVNNGYECVRQVG